MNMDLLELSEVNLKKKKNVQIVDVFPPVRAADFNFKVSMFFRYVSSASPAQNRAIFFYIGTKEATLSSMCCVPSGRW